MTATPRSFTLWIVLLFVGLGIVVLALWLDFRYQPPSFTIIDFSVPTSTGSHHTHQQPDIHVALNVKNSNNVYSITYDYIIVTIYYGQGTLGKDVTPLFIQKKKNEMVLQSSVKAEVHQEEALQKAISKSPGEARLKVELYAEIRYKNLGYNSKKTHLKYQGEFSIGSDGKISGKKKEVKLYKGSC